MPISLQDKKKIVEELTQDFKDAKSVIFCGFQKLPVLEIRKLKKDLREKKVAYKVVKKTLLLRVLKKLNLSGKEIEEAKIPLACAVSPDEVSAAKIIQKFAKEKETFEILSGVLENKIISKAEILALAKLPGKEELLAKFVFVAASPLSSFVNVLQGSVRKLVYALTAVRYAKK